MALIVRTLLALLARMPLSWVRAIGRTVGRLLYRFDSREARNARVNLTLCFPMLSDGERERRVRQVLIENGATFAEMPKIWLSTGIDWGQRIDAADAPEGLGRELAKGKGLILAVPHLGNWELAAYIMRTISPLTSLYRPPRQPFLDDIIRNGRIKSGMTPVPIDRSGLKALNDAIRRGETVAILPDQLPKGAGAASVEAPFFGQPVATMTLVNRLARKHGCPVVFLWAERDAVGNYVTRHFVGDPAIADEDPVRAATALNAGIERCVRQCPLQYQWTYRRFEPLDGSRPNPYRQ